MAVQLEEIAGVPTHVLHLRAEEWEGAQCPDQTPLVVIIPGSPGMGHFYLPFASRLFALGGGSYEVSVLSHAGHSPGHYKNTGNPSLGSSRAEEDSDRCGQETDWYSLQDQVTHKVAFVEQELERRQSLVLVGHSIGCWIILQMLKTLDPTRISRVFFLFPTIERMAETPNALSPVSYLWNSLRKPFTVMVWVSANFLPDFIKRWVLSWHFYTTPRPHLEHISRGAINIDEKSIYNVLKMARQEMTEVVECPIDVIDSNIDKMVFYYGVGDRWNVEGCYGDMAARYPGKEVHLCELNIEHAFVETSSDVMAEYVHSKLLPS